jgi:hypothetical protein
MTRSLVFALALLSALVLSASALAEVVQQGTLRVSIATQVKPYRLPRTDPAPIKVLIAGHVWTSTGAVPSQLTRLTVLINKHGELRPGAIPSCGIDEIRPSTTAQAIEHCGPALVGSGHFWASVVLPEQGVYHTTGRLLAFNGTQTICPGAESGGGGSENPQTPSVRVRPSNSRTLGGRGGEPADAGDPNPSDRGQRDATCRTRPEFLAQIYTTQPFPSSFVVPFSIRHIDRGPYGTELSGSLPQALGEWGFVNRIKMTLGREVMIDGRTHSYLRASCPAPKGTKGASFSLAQAHFHFATGEELTANVPKSCGVKE